MSTVILLVACTTGVNPANEIAPNGTDTSTSSPVNTVGACPVKAIAPTGMLTVIFAVASIVGVWPVSVIDPTGTFTVTPPGATEVVK